MTLLLVDGSNVLLRCAFGGDLPPDVATRNSISMIERAIGEVKATRLGVALDDTEGPSRRKLQHPEYKAHRTVQAAPWVGHGAEAMSGRGSCVQVARGVEG